MITHEVPPNYRWSDYTVLTGEHCPKTGWWRPIQTESANHVQGPKFVGQGCLMPAIGGEPGFWLLSHGRGK